MESAVFLLTTSDDDLRGNMSSSFHCSASTKTIFLALKSNQKSNNMVKKSSYAIHGLWRIHCTFGTRISL